VVSDEALMGEVQAGSTSAFEALYDRFSVRAYRVARAVCRNDGRAAEAVQEAFISIWRSHTSYDPSRGTPAAWILAMTRYRAIDVVRRNRPHAAHRASDDTLAAVPGPDDVAGQAAARDRADDLRMLLIALPEPQREVITLAYYGELSHSEIATHLDLPAGTVKGRMRLGLARLRDAMEQAAG
jgi:RNA polymerase sigma-70 factor, ECF subfamily